MPVNILSMIAVLALIHNSIVLIYIQRGKYS